MRPKQAHFVTGCQQLLALGLVLAVLTPAASVVSLDVVREEPGDRAGATATGIGAEARRRIEVAALVRAADPAAEDDDLDMEEAARVAEWDAEVERPAPSAAARVAVT